MKCDKTSVVAFQNKSIENLEFCVMDDSNYFNLSLQKRLLKDFLIHESIIITCKSEKVLVLLNYD